MIVIAGWENGMSWWFKRLLLIFGVSALLGGTAFLAAIFGFGLPIVGLAGIVAASVFMGIFLIGTLIAKIIKVYSVLSLLKDNKDKEKVKGEIDLENKVEKPIMTEKEFNEKSEKLFNVCKTGEHDKMMKLLSEANKISKKHCSELINAVDEETGFTPIMMACDSMKPLLVHRLAKYGADLTVINKNGDTALDIACFKSNENCVSNLLSFPTSTLNSLKKRDNKGIRDFTFLLDHDAGSLLKKLLMKGLNPDSNCHALYSKPLLIYVLMYAYAYSGSILKIGGSDFKLEEKIYLLLGYGADVKAIDMTPWPYAKVKDCYGHFTGNGITPEITDFITYLKPYGTVQAMMKLPELKSLRDEYEVLSPEDKKQIIIFLLCGKHLKTKIAIPKPVWLYMAKMLLPSKPIYNVQKMIAGKACWQGAIQEEKVKQKNSLLTTSIPINSLLDYFKEENYLDQSRILVTLNNDKNKINEKNSVDQKNVLHCACQNENLTIDIIKNLLSRKGELVEEKDSFGKIPLVYACEAKKVNYEIALFLFKKINNKENFEKDNPKIFCFIRLLEAKGSVAEVLKVLPEKFTEVSFFKKKEIIAESEVLDKYSLEEFQKAWEAVNQKAILGSENKMG